MNENRLDNLDEHQEELLKSYWLSLISSIDLDPSRFVQSKNGEELFYLFGLDHPDGILLRWLRARKWQIPSALQLMLDTLQWRQQWGVRKLLSNGENDLNNDECSSGKTYHMGKDKRGRPLTYVHTSEHIRGQFPLQDTEKFLVLIMETGRYLPSDGIEEGTVVLDMSNVALKNLDYQHIKFMINTMQNYYPECLANAFIVNAPWTFNTVWSVIKPWLDPVVESKIRFIKTSKDLTEFIHPDSIPRRLEGNQPDFKYIPLTKQDQQRLKTFRENQQGFQRAQSEHQQAAKHFLELTIKWAKSKQKTDQDRINAIQSLKDSFEQLLPYVTTETFYHRTGIINHHIFNQTFQQITNDDEQTTRL